MCLCRNMYNYHYFTSDEEKVINLFVSFCLLFQPIVHQALASKLGHGKIDEKLMTQLFSVLQHAEDSLGTDQKFLGVGYPFARDNVFIQGVKGVLCHTKFIFLSYMYLWSFNESILFTFVQVAQFYRWKTPNIYFLKGVLEICNKISWSQ